MSFLTDDDITLFRADVDGLRRVSFTIVRPRVIDDGAGGTKPDPAGPLYIGPLFGSFSAAGGREIQTPDQIKQRGSYRLRSAVELIDPDAEEAVTIEETDQIELLDTLYKVIWAPPPTETNLSRVVGLEEA